MEELAHFVEQGDVVVLLGSFGTQSLQFLVGCLQCLFCLFACGDIEKYATDIFNRALFIKNYLSPFLYPENLAMRIIYPVFPDI